MTYQSMFYVLAIVVCICGSGICVHLGSGLLMLGFAICAFVACVGLVVSL